MIKRLWWLWYIFLVAVSEYITDWMVLFYTEVAAYLVGAYIPGTMEDMAFLVWIILCLLVALGREHD
jgi:hypothetical protein